MTQREKASAHRAILACFDYSDTSGLALSSAADIVRSDPSTELHIVHVVRPPYPTMYGNVQTRDFQVALDTMDVEHELPRFCGRNISDLGGRVIGHVAFGRPHHEIVILARDINADLIVIGTRERTLLDGVFLASVAERVLRTAPCPVLAVRLKDRRRDSLIEPLCPDCAALRHSSLSGRMWCTRHDTQNARSRTHRGFPESFAIGSISFPFREL